MRIKKNDLVMVLAGKDKGKTGQVQRVLSKKDEVVIEGINLSKKHIKPSSKRPKGGIITLPAPIHQSNWILVCKNCSKPTRPNIVFNKQKKVKERICQKCGNPIDQELKKS